MHRYNPDNPPEFIKKQYEFAAHIRNPEKYPAPDDVETRRMKIYSELFYNNVEGFMSNTYPVLREILGETRWHALVRDYFEHHRARTPLFPEMPREFLKYLENERAPQDDDYPFMLELAHYEWVELALSVSDATNEEDIDAEGDLLEGVPVLSVLAWPLSYQYPVHHISTDYLPDTPPEHPTYIIAHRRNQEDGEVHFTEINAVTARLLNLIQENENGQTGRQLLLQLAEEMNSPDPEQIISFGASLLNDLHTKGILPGTRTPFSRQNKNNKPS